MWADVIPLHVTASGQGGKPTNEGDGLALQTRKLANSETTIRKPQAQGTPWNGHTMPSTKFPGIGLFRHTW
jgi:hypothetical protein